MPYPRSVHDILTSAETAMCVPCVWQWDVDELDSLVKEIEAGEATLPARRLLAIALARKGDMPGAETQARAVLRTRVRTVLTMALPAVYGLYLLWLVTVR